MKANNLGGGFNRQEVPVNPDMIVLGRESRGLSQKMFATALGIVQATVSKMEAAMLPVSDDMLERIATVLGYPLHFFRQQGGLFGVGVAEIFHRKRQDVPKKVLSCVYAQMDIRMRNLHTLLQSGDLPVDVSRIEVEDYDGDAEEVARLVRAAWHIPRGPIKDLTSTLEDRGVVIVPFDFGTKRIDAISRWIPTLPPVIFVNKDIPKDRYRSSVAHELGHIIMHTLPHPDIEDQANKFAAELLLPAQSVIADLTDLSISKLSALKRYWRVSMAMQLKRAEDLQTITHNQARYMWTQLSQAGYKTREPVELDVDGEEPSLVQELIQAHREDLRYSDADLAELLALTEDEFAVIYLQPRRKKGLYVVQ